MNDSSVVAKFLVTVVGVVLALSAIYPVKYLTYKMAEAAIEAQKHDMSFGKFSRQMWAPHRRHH